MTSKWLEENAELLLILLIAAALMFGIYAAFKRSAGDPIMLSCIHPATDSMGTFVGECLNQGYEFSQCYYEYVDFMHGGEVLEMPRTWV